MDIDKFVPMEYVFNRAFSFGSLMDIDKFVLVESAKLDASSFGSLMDIDKFVQQADDSYF